MKKVLAIVLALAMVLALCACGTSNGGTSGGDKTGVDMSKYPTDLNSWTAQNFNDYYTECGVYTDSQYAYIQDHATYWTGTPMDEAGGYMDDVGATSIICLVDPDSTEGDASALLEYVRANKTLDEDLGSMAVDHLAGNVVFIYGISSDEDFYNNMEKATQDLFTALKVTPDF